MYLAATTAAPWLSVKRTQVSFVSPYVAYQGASGNVVIRGEEFSQLSSAIQNVLFGFTLVNHSTAVADPVCSGGGDGRVAAGSAPAQADDQISL